MNPEPTHILWDHDGVLVDTEPLYFEANRRALSNLGVELSESLYLKLMARGESAWDIARAGGVGEADIAHWRAQRDVWYQEYITTADIDIDGVEDVLSRLGERYRMAIVTTARPEDFNLIHASRNITRHMDFVLTNVDYPRSKPAPDPYLAALARYDVAPEKAVVVEDSQRGLAAAVAAGIRCVVVNNAFTRAQDFSAATTIINSLEELPEVLTS